MLDVTPAFALNSTTTNTVTRTTYVAGEHVDGYWVEGAKTASTIEASIQPISKQDYENLPQGIRDECTAIALTVVAVKSGDILEEAGRRYRVLASDDWSLLGGFYEFYLGEQRDG